MTIPSSGSSGGTSATTVAHVAPGSAGYNLLCSPGQAGVLLADFERNGAVDHTIPEYLARITRPGAILLANLDIDDLARVPSPPPADMVSLLDGRDALINGAADEGELSLIKVRKPNPCSLTAASVVIRVHARDAQRIRIFQVGAGPAPILGEGSPGSRREFRIPTPAPPNAWAFDYRVEALTLPGDPRFPEPLGAAPSRPTPYAATLPAGSSGTPIYSTRAPGDVWVELVHQNSAGADVSAPREVALLTIAPFMLLSNLHRVERIYAVSFSWNHDFIYDLAEAIQAAIGGVTLPPDTSTRFTPHRPPYDPALTPASTPGNLYLIDGTRFPDRWIQDEMEIGYSFAPHGWMHVVLHCKRERELSDFLHQEIPAPNVGLFDGIHGGTPDSVDFGGNLEISPPVTVATPALPRDAGGPSVKPHRAAHFGKILVGDCTPRALDPVFHDFLVAQRVQPVLPIDTSWLSVGHVDEIISFAPSSRGRHFCLIMASVQAMTVLLEEAERIPVASGRTNFHRGRYRDLNRVAATYAEETLEHYLHGPVRAFSDQLRTDKLIPIERRLKRGLALNADEIVRFPTYFEVPANASAAYGDPANQTVAETVGSVNMLVVNNHLMIPRPFGPRLRASDCNTVLRRALDRLGLASAAVRLPPANGFWFWAFPNETVLRLAAYFVQPPTVPERDEIIAHLRTGSVLSPANAARVASIAMAISTHPSNTAAPGIGTVAPAGVFNRWRRVFIPETTVDLMEAYMLSVLAPHSLSLHFIDDFHPYHIAMGEVHCGTNARRRPPELSNAQRWWDDYAPDYDVTYNPAS